MNEMLKQFVDSVFSTPGVKLGEYVSDILRNKINLNSTLELSGKKKRKREVEEWLEQVNMIKNEIRTLEREVQTEGFLRKFLTGDQATQLSASVNKLLEQSQQFGEPVVDVDETRRVPLLTTELTGEGFEKNLNRIWNSLKSDEVRSVGIYGMGGVGKTALAKKINNIILEKSQEKRVCWITVSQDFSIKKLQDEIASFLRLDLSDEGNEDKRAARLHQAIGKNFVLILDNLWENIRLEKLGDPLRLEGCKLILTTRSFQVCCQLGCQEKVEVKKLHTDEAWNLFKQILEQDTELTPEIEETAKKLVKLCDGLPLGIIVLAGSMRGETSIHVWRNELEKLRDPNMVQNDKEDDVFKVLRHSFDRLDSNHQLCFLLCSLFPEDFEIYKDELVRIFISEESVEVRKSRQSQFDQVHSILNKLVKVCLLEESDGGYFVKMHDLVRLMALKITKGKYKVISGFLLGGIPNEGEWIRDLEKVCLSGIEEIPNGMSPDCPKLSTLIFYHSCLKFIPNSFFSHLDNLCFLKVCDASIEKVPDSLSNLENLKTLILEGCERLVDIPDLGKLKKLRELDLCGMAIKTVPQGMEELVNLRFLSLIFAVRLETLPEGLFLNFSLLQCLRLPFQIKAPIEEILRLKYLEQFWGRVNNVSDVCKFIRCKQSQLTRFAIVAKPYYEDHDWPDFWNGNQMALYRCDLKNEEEKDFGMVSRIVKV